MQKLCSGSPGEDKPMSLVVISIDRGKLPEHTQEEFEEWVKYEVGDTPEMNMTNPLVMECFEADVKEIGN